MRWLRLTVAALTASVASCTLWFAATDSYTGIGKDAAGDALEASACANLGCVPNATCNERDGGAATCLQAVTSADGGAASILAIAASAGTLYMLDTQGVVSSCTGDCDARTILNVGDCTTTTPLLAANSSGALCSSTGFVGIKQITSDGGLRLAATAPQTPGELAANDELVVYTSNGDLYSCSLDASCGSTMPPLARVLIDSGVGTRAPAASEAKVIFWSASDTSLGVVDLDSGVVTRDPSYTSGGALAASASSIYWTDKNNILSNSSLLSPLVKPFIVRTRVAGVLYATETTLYWADDVASPTAIGACAKPWPEAGCSSPTYDTGVTLSARAVAATSSAIFVLSSSNVLYRYVF